MAAKRILIVDDEEDFITLISVRLEEAGFEVYAETDGTRALQKARELKPDVVLLDVMLPGTDGLVLMKAVKKELPNIPVVILTGKAVMMKDVFNMEGASGFFKKPVDFKELVLKVRGLVG